MSDTPTQPDDPGAVPDDPDAGEDTAEWPLPADDPAEEPSHDPTPPPDAS